MTTTEPQVAARTASARAMWAILALVLLADALDMIDSTVTNIAAPTIVADLGGGEGLIKWLGTAYMLAMGVLLVVGGRLGDKFGQRRLFLVGMTGFTLASAVAGLSPDPALLVAARAAQGAFGALMLPQGMAIMTRTFSRDMLSKAFGFFGPLLGVATVGGPVLAGFIIDADLFGLTWRPIFLVNVILGVIGLAVAVRILPHDQGDRSTVVDGWGSGLLAGTMFGLLYGLIEGSTNGWGPLAVGAVVAGVVFFVGFAYRQRTAPDPLIKPSLLRNRGFTSGMLVGLVVFAALTGLVYVLSLFMQTGLDASAREASLALLPLTLGIIASAFAAMGGLVAKLGRTLIFLGLAAVLLGAAWVFALVVASGTDVGLWSLTPALFVIGLGMGCCFSAIFDVALGDIDPDEAGSASGSLSAVQQLAAGIGSAAVTSIFFQTASGGMDHAMRVTLLVVVALIAIAVPVVTLMPRKAPQETHH
ncbi:drug resistance transporter, EmrB/QacA subfamily [Sanguibacter gelidistatuariae]|uniref:Drug resistance transporter, EmrB/QacA subfamily n=1 Tax=Sanguibacter gelidistatuariae TaxID=1814289 RepID=A0A1G6H678_9MICO|nr:MFS transporter [Sanguibacter gelidistatuariae]SDB89674.1 drug resistance transporter, EmrB/QacA subfamily [Sanguibacter gelidistatuariae]